MTKQELQSAVDKILSLAVIPASETDSIFLRYHNARITMRASPDLLVALQNLTQVMENYYNALCRIGHTNRYTEAILEQAKAAIALVEPE